MVGVAGDNVVSFATLRGKVDETGQDVTISAPRRRKRKQGWREHVALIDFELMAKLEMTGGETRLFWTVCSHIPNRGGSEAFTTAAELASEMGVSQQYVSQVLKTLSERHIIWKLRTGKYRVSAWLTYNGDFDAFNAEAENDPEPIWVRGVDAKTGEIK